MYNNKHMFGPAGSIGLLFQLVEVVKLYGNRDFGIVYISIST